MRCWDRVYEWVVGCQLALASLKELTCDQQHNLLTCTSSYWAYYKLAVVRDLPWSALDGNSN